MDLYVIELEPEVEQWLNSLPDREYGRIMAYAELLAQDGDTLSEPYSRHIGGQVRELRIPLHPIDVRVTYWLAPDRRAIMLTVSGRRGVASRRRSRGLGRHRRSARQCMGMHRGRMTGRLDVSEHGRWDVRRRNSAEARAGYEEAKRAIAIGKAIRERRLALGLSQSELARRAGMTQPALSRLEAGGTVPTIPVLERLAKALNADLVVALNPRAA